MRRDLTNVRHLMQVKYIDGWLAQQSPDYSVQAKVDPASSTRLSEALRREHSHHALATYVTRDVLVNPRASDEVRAAALVLLAWLSLPAETIAKR